MTYNLYANPHVSLIFRVYRYKMGPYFPQTISAATIFRYRNNNK